LSPIKAPSRFLKTVKGYTAREANRLLERTGQPFWQAETYDHWVRDEKQAERIRVCVENNPVQAGWWSGRMTFGGRVRRSGAEPSREDSTLGSAG
jgi:hypothetical protein